jgi:predicted nucleic acid-binding protein
MCRIFVCGFCCHVGRIVNYVTRVAAKSTDKKASEIGILINASSLISDAGPLIALSRIEQLGLLNKLYGTVFIPVAVHKELCCDTNLPGARCLRLAFNDGWIEVHDLVDETGALVRLRLILNPGESQAILLAEHVGGRFLLMDERRGRQVAKSRGLKVVGIACVLLAAKQKGLLEAVAPELDALCRAGYRLSAQLIDEVLRLAGELDKDGV